jgi:predicted ATP-dependent protease
MNMTRTQKRLLKKTGPGAGVFEPAPTFQNLFGKIERIPAKGTTVTDFTMVQAGALLRADKGFLMLEIDPLLRNSAVWETLKTTLQNKQLFIQDAPDQAGMVLSSLRPDPIPLDVKVILVGRYDIFLALQGKCNCGIRQQNC